VEDHSSSRNEQSDELRERWGLGLFEEGGSTKAGSHECFEQCAIGVALYSRDGTPRKEGSEQRQQDESWIGSSLSEPRSGNG
jgi:hypothetical protein